MLAAILNHDKIAGLIPQTTKMVTVQVPARNAELSESLKAYYDYRCQICSHSYQASHGVSVVDTHHIRYLRNGGPDVSWNMLVLCPNHHRLIHATDAKFDRKAMAYRYPNGIAEPLALIDHLLEAQSLGLMVADGN